jgi:hypothetical protein
MSIRASEKLKVCKPRRFALHPITTACADADSSIDPHHGGVSRDKDQEKVIGHTKEKWGSTVLASAKLFLYTVRDSADAFPPLKSVVGGLCSILESCEVRFISQTDLEPRCSNSPSEHRETGKR